MTWPWQYIVAFVIVPVLGSRLTPGLGTPLGSPLRLLPPRLHPASAALGALCYPRRDTQVIVCRRKDFIPALVLSRMCIFWGSAGVWLRATKQTSFLDEGALLLGIGSGLLEESLSGLAQKVTESLLSELLMSGSLWWRLRLNRAVATSGTLTKTRTYREDVIFTWTVFHWHHCLCLW